ncbi:MAG: response regulator [Anaerolineales bacterium]|nr:response regulator [Anaerolineales bacterium]
MAEKILLVDDDLDTLRLVGLMLQRQGYQIRAASDGPQALAMVESEIPDLILLDIMMPDMDGYEVARRLRANPRATDVPIIMFTAKAQIDDKVMGFEAGADDYLTKPIQPRELIAHMKAVLSRVQKRQTSAPTSTETPLERGYMVGVISVRGGLGVSTVALNLGIALHQEQKKDVIIADFRPGQGTIGLELGYLRSDAINRLVQRKPTEISARDIENEIITHPTGVRLLLSSHHPGDARYLNAVANFEAIAVHLVRMARYVVLDLGTGLSPINEKIINICDEICIVVEPVPQTLIQSKALLDDLIAKGIGEGRIDIVLVNRVRSGVQLSWSQVQEQLGKNISVIFTPAPELAYQASMHNLPLISQQPDSLTAQQFIKLAEKVAQRNQ